MAPKVVLWPPHAQVWVTRTHVNSWTQWHTPIFPATAIWETEPWKLEWGRRVGGVGRRQYGLWSEVPWQRHLRTPKAILWSPTHTYTMYMYTHTYSLAHKCMNQKHIHYEIMYTLNLHDFYLLIISYESEKTLNMRHIYTNSFSKPLIFLTLTFFKKFYINVLLCQKSNILRVCHQFK